MLLALLDVCTRLANVRDGKNRRSAVGRFGAFAEAANAYSRPVAVICCSSETAIQTADS